MNPYRNVNFLFTLLLMLSIEFSQLNAQRVSSDSIFVIQINEELYIPHVIQSGNTIYNLCTRFGYNVQELSQLLELKEPFILSLGDTLLIPLKMDRMEGVPSENAFPVYYRVKPKETLFRIARIYMKWKEEQLMVLNLLENTDLQIDQTLLLGYCHFDRRSENDKTPESVSTFEEIKSLSFTKEEINEVENLKEDQSIKELLKEKVYAEITGVAIWFDDTDVNSGRFVMHEKAPVNSIIAITNPMFNKTVYAKVIGNIPPNTYPREVVAVISPALAKELGALDKRFFAKIKYEVAVGL